MKTRHPVAITVALVGLLFAGQACAQSPAADSYSVNPNPGQGLYYMPTASGPSGQTCTPPDPRWILVSREGSQCVYRAPGNNVKLQAEQGQFAPTVNNQAIYEATQRDPNGIPINTRPALKSGTRVLASTVAIQEWCDIWDNKVKAMTDQETARFKRAYNATPGVMSYDGSRRESENCRFTATITQDGWVSMRTVPKTMKCPELLNSLATISMPPFPSSSPLRSITLYPSLLLAYPVCCQLHSRVSPVAAVEFFIRGG